MEKMLAGSRLSRALALALLGMAAGPAWTQDQDADAQADASAAPQAGSDSTEEEALDEIVVTGYRGSLTSATNSKRESVLFTDTVFAEDIGKFPDLNIAESLNRIPGIQLTREVNGEGVNVAIRGLGTNFTKILLNNTQIAVASTGGTDAQNQNREVDLNLFPTELFTQLTVSKTPSASMVEGGVAGVVNLRSARPFDNPGTHFNYQAQAGYGEISEDFSPRGAFTGSWTNDAETWGILGGIAAESNKYAVEGFETIGWTNPSLTFAQCGVTPPAGTPATNPGPCNVGGGGNWTIPATVPATAGAGLPVGATIDRAFLLARNPGLSIEQLDRALIPRLGRPAVHDGERDRVAGIVSLEFRPNESMRFYLDTLYADADRSNDRIDINLIARNSALIPVNWQVDSNNVVTSGTFANAQYFLEARPYQEELSFYNINPGSELLFGDNQDIKLSVQGNISRSIFRRESPSILVNTPFTTVEYSNNGGDFPTFSTPLNLNDPNIGWLWNGGRLNIQNEKRVTENKGARADLQFGPDVSNVRVGVAWDDIERRIRAFDNSAAWENVACRGLNPDGSVPNPRPGCVGGPLAAITQAELASYLLPGPNGFITADFTRLFNDTNYRALSDSAPESNSANTGAASGDVRERNLAGFIEVNGEADIWDRNLRFNAGVRYVHTDQTIRGPVTIANVRSLQSLYTSYEEALPSFNAAWDVYYSVVLRMAASRTLTRPNPSVMLPNTNFSDPSAQTATQGNPNLAPFLSTNIDLGGEWYTGDEGYIGLSLFNKRVNGFTVNGTNTIPFTQLGIPFETLTDLQQVAINSRGGPNVATVTVQQQVNANGNLRIRGWELNWVQPLDFVLEGLGVSANYTRVMQKSEGQGVPAQAIGVSPHTYNGTLYWEKDRFTVRASYTWNDDQISSGLNQNGIPAAQLFTDARGQWDLSASYALPDLPTAPQVTLNVINATGEPIRQTFQYDNATFTYYDGGYTVLLGVRGSF